MTETLSAALNYADRFGWPVFPVSINKRPLSKHGCKDATRDPATIEAWFARWPDALIAIATGVDAGIAAIDVDVRDTIDGRDSLEALGVALHPVTPTAHTPSGGFHLLFRHPGGFVKTVASELGPGLDIRGDGGSITLPPGPGRFWDPHLSPDSTPFADFPEWAIIPEPVIERTVIAFPSIKLTVSRYGEAALDSAFEAIVSATAGQQELTLNREAFGIGQLVGGDEIPAAIAEDTLRLAASRMPSFDRGRPWRARDVERKIRDALFAGMRQPRRAGRG